MNKEQREKQQFQKEKNLFQPDTTSMQVQNQNQTHNAKKEGLGPNTKR